MSHGVSPPQRPDAPRSPRVAVVIPAHDAHATIAGCLESLAAQTFRDYETVVVDSSSGTDTSALVSSTFPHVTYLHSGMGPESQGPHNEGAQHTSASILVFTDPGICARPDWLEHLVRAHDETGEAIVGAIDCFGRRWLDRGIHISRFGKWLPGGARREVDMGPSAALLVRRTDYDSAGGFRGDPVLDDVEFSHALRVRGRGLVFEPRAIVEYHHAQSLSGFVRERWSWGVTYGRLCAAHRANDRLELLGWLLVTALPIRFVQSTMLVVSLCSNAGWLGRLAATSPLVALGHASALGGEALAYAQLLLSKKGCPPAGASASFVRK